MHTLLPGLWARCSLLSARLSCCAAHIGAAMMSAVTMCTLSSEGWGCVAIGTMAIQRHKSPCSICWMLQLHVNAWNLRRQRAHVDFAIQGANRTPNNACRCVFQDYTTALVADGRPGEAIAKLEALATQIKGNAVTDPNSIQPIEVDLLVGKVYTQWKGHSNEALGTYDKIIAEYPADFRYVCFFCFFFRFGLLSTACCRHAYAQQVTGASTA